MEKTTITKTSENTIEAADSSGHTQVWWTRKGYMEKMNLSANSLNSPYNHVRDNRAEQFNFFSMSFFRPI